MLSANLKSIAVMLITKKILFYSLVNFTIPLTNT